MVIRLLLSIATAHKSTSTWPAKQVKDYLRYAIWLTLVGTANANRRHFGLATTWVPHLLGNSIALLLPEIYQGLNTLFGLKKRLRPDRSPTGSTLWSALGQLVEDNPDYIDYVAPAALAYIVSHPKFNIYRDHWAELKFLGFGLDSVPHGTTAYALSHLTYDTIEALEQNMPPADTSLQPFIKWLGDHKILTTAASIAGLTFIYELAEYLIHKFELKARHNDISQINMMWSPKDMIFDIISNTIGWACLVWRHRE